MLPHASDLLARATRFFARVWGNFDAECPACGTLYRVGPKRLLKPKGADEKVYDPRTGVFHCQQQGCGRSYTVGLLFTPRLASAGKTLPQDQLPNVRQIAELRREGGGWWLPDDVAHRHQRLDTSNLTPEPSRYAVESPEDEDDTQEACDAPDLRFGDHQGAIGSTRERKARGLDPQEDE